MIFKKKNAKEIYLDLHNAYCLSAHFLNGLKVDPRHLYSMGIGGVNTHTLQGVH